MMMVAVIMAVAHNKETKEVNLQATEMAVPAATGMMILDQTEAADGMEIRKDILKLHADAEAMVAASRTMTMAEDFHLIMITIAIPVLTAAGGMEIRKDTLKLHAEAVEVMVAASRMMTMAEDFHLMMTDATIAIPVRMDVAGMAIQRDMQKPHKWVGNTVMVVTDLLEEVATVEAITPALQVEIQTKAVAGMEILQAIHKPQKKVGLTAKNNTFFLKEIDWISLLFYGQMAHLRHCYCTIQMFINFLSQIFNLSNSNLN
jgi:hypothetical protein